MGRYAQFVVGPAGSGKSTYCFTMRQHMHANSQRLLPLVVNLDPGNERSEEAEKENPFDLDVRDLISVTDVLEELDFGPNGALVFCMEHLVSNLEWLKEGLDEIGGSDDIYFIFDCPGQLELYTHLPVLKEVVTFLTEQCNLQICVVHILDALFIDDPAKYISGSLLALTSMVQLSSPAVNVITKCDLKKQALGGGRKKRTLPKIANPFSQIGGNIARTLEELDEAEAHAYSDSEEDSDLDFIDAEDPDYLNPSTLDLQTALDGTALSEKGKGLSYAMSNLLESYSLVNFLPFDITSEDSIDYVLQHIDNATQYGEDLEPRDPGMDELDQEPPPDDVDTLLDQYM